MTEFKATLLNESQQVFKTFLDSKSLAEQTAWLNALREIIDFGPIEDILTDSERTICIKSGKHMTERQLFGKNEDVMVQEIIELAATRGITVVNDPPESHGYCKFCKWRN